MRLLLVALAIVSPFAVAATAAADKGARPRPQARAAASPPPRPTAAQLARYAEGARLFAAGDYAAAQHALTPLTAAPLASRDTLLYLLASSEASQVPPATDRALGHFRALAAMQQSRYLALARARAADLLFDLGRLAEAAQGYAEVLRAPAPAVEPAVARFRLAEIAERQGRRAEALSGWRRVFVEHPSHPLAERAFDRLRAALPLPTGQPTGQPTAHPAAQPTGQPTAQPAAQPTAAERIERARHLVAEHAWERALDELRAIASEGLGQAVRDEVDYQIGMTHFKMRHGYDIAAQKLLGVWERLAVERQPDALFHGARAWSRSGQDDAATDRAIEGYRLVVDKFPASKPAKEAHFLIGWLEFNRGRYAAGLPTLDEVASRDHSDFSDDAAWFAAYSRWLMDDPQGALASFEAYERLASGALGDGKARYWKGRALDRLGRQGEAMRAWRGVVDAFPFSYYAQQARVRLLGAGDRMGPLGSRVPSTPATPLGEAAGEAARPVVEDARVVRVDELLAAGLRVEAAAELDRVDGALLKQYGGPRALPVLFDRYGRAEDFFHVHRGERAGESANIGNLALQAGYTFFIL